MAATPAPQIDLADARTFVRVGVRPDTEAAAQAVPDPETGQIALRVDDHERGWSKLVVRMRIVESCIVGRAGSGAQADLVGCDALLTLWLPDRDAPSDDWKRERLVRWAAAMSGQAPDDVNGLGIEQLVALIGQHAASRCHLVAIQTDQRGLLQVRLGRAFDETLRPLPDQLDPRLAERSFVAGAGNAQRLLDQTRWPLDPEAVQGLLGGQRMLTSAREVRELADHLGWVFDTMGRIVVGLDLESDFGPLGPPADWDARDGAIRLLQLAVPGEGVFLVDCRKASPLPLLHLLRHRNVRVVIHYAGFEQQWLSWGFGIEELPQVHDTRVSWLIVQQHLALLDPDYEQTGNTLEEVVELIHGVPLDKQLGRQTWWGAEILGERELRYAALDAAILPLLWEVTERVVHELGCWAQVEQATQRILQRAARIRVEDDDAALERQAAELIEQVDGRQDVLQLGQTLASLPLSWRQRARLAEQLRTKLPASQPASTTSSGSSRIDFARLRRGRSTNAESSEGGGAPSEATPTVDLAPAPARGTIIVANRHHGAEGLYIGRGTPLGNPFKRPDDGTTREEAIARYRRWLWQQLQADTPQRTAVRTLAGKLARGQDITLVCSCAPKPCHGDVVAAAVQWTLDQQAATP